MDESSRLKAVKFICARATLADAGLAARFEIRRGDRELPAFVVAFAGEVHAWVNACPHRGTSLDWQPGEVFDDSGLYLICATHGALFEPDTGVCIDGPCRGARLSVVPVVVQEGEVRLAQDSRVLGQDS